MFFGRVQRQQQQQQRRLPLLPWRATARGGVGGSGARRLAMHTDDDEEQQEGSASSSGGYHEELQQPVSLPKIPMSSLAIPAEEEGESGLEALTAAWEGAAAPVAGEYSEEDE